MKVLIIHRLYRNGFLRKNRSGNGKKRSCEGVDRSMVRSREGDDLYIVLTVIAGAAAFIVMVVTTVALVIWVDILAGKGGKERHDIGPVVVSVRMDVETYYRTKIAYGQKTTGQNFMQILQVHYSFV